MRGRLTVGQLVLVQPIGVRIPAPQPYVSFPTLPYGFFIKNMKISRKAEAGPEKFNTEPDNTVEGESEKKDKLKKLLGEMAEHLQEQGVPVNEGCRINMDFFKSEEGHSPETIDCDKRNINRLEKEWYGNLSQEEIREKRGKSRGEKFEILKTLVFHKFIGEDFITVRTSQYDDIKNKVDNLIIDKKTGNSICALDEVVDNFDERTEEKKKKTLERNREGGGQLKYGLSLQEEKIVPARIKNIPLLYLVFPGKNLEQAIERIAPSLTEKSEYEEKIFRYFISLIVSQIKSLKLKNLPQELIERMNFFEKTLSEL